MKRILFVSMLLTTFAVRSYSQHELDSLREKIDIHSGSISGLDERLLTAESDLQKLTKIKFSGYVQAQYDYYDYKTTPNNTFYIRRARLKTAYEAADGIKFVLQPDFSVNGIALKDAYVVANLKKIKWASLWMGQFDRPNYEVEYSSGQLEALERSRIIRTLYPGEKEIGAKLELKPSKIPLKFQFAALNGNFSGTQAKDMDNEKDYMARVVYSLNLKKQGIGIDFGVNTYQGMLQTQASKYVLTSDNKIDSFGLGHYMKKSWYGAEMQFYWDFLGGLALKGEYIFGQTGTASSDGNPTVNTSFDTITPASMSGKKVSPAGTDGSFTTTTTNVTKSKSPIIEGNYLYTTTTSVVKTSPNKVRNFSGFYVYLIKNIGKKNQLVIRYDAYDPNSKLSGDDAGNDVYYRTLDIAWQYYLNDNIRISLLIDMPTNETNKTNKSDILDNTYSIRLQAKF